jgi:hypothetical protein
VIVNLGRLRPFEIIAGALGPLRVPPARGRNLSGVVRTPAAKATSLGWPVAAGGPDDVLDSTELAAFALYIGVISWK